MAKKKAEKVKDICNLRLNDAERELLQLIADEFTGGNMSAWIRQRALRPGLEEEFSAFLAEHPELCDKIGPR